MRENKERSSFSRSAPATMRLPIDSISSHDAGETLAELAFTRNSARASFGLVHEGLFVSLLSNMLPVRYRPRICRSPFKLETVYIQQPELHSRCRTSLQP